MTLDDLAFLGLRLSIAATATGQVVGMLAWQAAVEVSAGRPSPSFRVGEPQRAGNR